MPQPLGLPTRRALFLLPMLLLARPTLADDRRGHERARAALQAGEIRPLAELMVEVERRWIGRVVETELERVDGAWIYEFKLLPPSGRVFEIKLDARTGALLRTRGPVQERR